MQQNTFFHLTNFLEEYVYPLLEAQAYINDGSGKPMQIDGKKKKSIYLEGGGSFGTRNLEGRAYSVGSKP